MTANISITIEKPNARVLLSSATTIGFKWKYILALHVQIISSNKKNPTIKNRYGDRRSSKGRVDLGIMMI